MTYFDDFLKKEKDESAFHEAARNGDFDIVRQYIEDGININSCSNYAVRASAEHGHLEIFQYLVENGGDISNSCLGYILDHGHVHVAEYYLTLDHNSSLSYELKFCIERNNYIGINFLLNEGVSVGILEGHELWQCIEKNSIDIIKLLTEHGANFNGLKNITVKKDDQERINYLEENGIEYSIDDNNDE